jgi:hypothetical protein
MNVLDTREDMAWLWDVHLKTLKRAKSAVLIGNEDYPSRIDLYAVKSPQVDDQPAASITLGDSYGDL